MSDSSGGRASLPAGQRTAPPVTDSTPHACRYFAPERDMQLARELYAEPFTYADFLEASGNTGTQDIDGVRRRLDA